MNYKRKELLKKLLRHTPIYKKTFYSISQPFDAETALKTNVKNYIENVPFFHSYKQYLKRNFNINNFPIIYKSDILGHEKEFINEKVNKHFIIKEKTGGSTGWSLNVYRNFSSIIKASAYVDYMFSLIGNNLKIAVLRGNKPKTGFFEIISNDKIILSSYSLSPESLDTYLNILKDYHISCIHAYPSSLGILSRLIKQKYGKADLPELKGILTSSEIFSREEKMLVSEVFPQVKIIDFYGMNERCCCAYSINLNNYTFIQRYGYTEFIPTGEKKGDNIIAEIVATSMMNTTMPFIRYATEDYVEIDPDDNIVSIIGRSSDFVVNNKKDIVPCISLTRNESMKNVINFQYYQDTLGVLEFKVVTNKNFNNEEKKMLEEDLNNSFDGKMTCIVVPVDYIERTKIGKQKRLVQKLDLSKY